ncbi:hypothetical protein HPB49_001070 [Dermacentor silvarum]|uniref:Uncharacterized protein n=1 Tax=Dermacentor silvarum TaxID=543639 RepID=A0ACB8CUF6_DERSI|nr:hypothetical protein HPB49_001070 [Dermacentor silvarum]
MTNIQKVQGAVKENGLMNNLVVILRLPGYNEQCKLASIADRFDCYPEPGSSQKGCEARGCCWGALGDASDGQPNIPYCYYPADYQGYGLDGLDRSPDGISARLSRKIPSGIDKDVQSVAVNVVFYANDTARITVSEFRHQKSPVSTWELRS